jgi:hypothetical protein
MILGDEDRIVSKVVGGTGRGFAKNEDLGGLATQPCGGESVRQLLVYR